MSRGQKLVLAAVAGFLYLPILVLALFSFNDSPLMAFPLSGLTDRWYRALWANRAFREGLMTSLLVAQPVGIGGMLLGLLAARALTAPGFRLAPAFAVLMLVPFLVPKSVLAIAQAMLLSRLGLKRGALALIAAQTLVVLPFTTVLLAAVLGRLDPRLEEAARDLGATPRQSFRLVVLPQIKPALVGAYSVGVILSLADLGIAMFLAGRTQPLALVVASEFRRELRPDLNAMQVVVLALTFLVLALSALVRRPGRRRGGAAAAAPAAEPPAPRRQQPAT